MQGSETSQRGFTLIDLMMAIGVLAIVAVIAVPSYARAINRAHTAQAVAEINELDGHIERFRTQHFRLPATLAELGRVIPPDPWGNDYVYLNIEAGVPLGKVRKDRNMNPLNSDYDLYSIGPDGRTATQLTAKAARDDIVRAGNGAFVGVADDH
jgi:general secretion pathway protein G